MLHLICMRRRGNGFTLIELLCVTAIIGILASMLLGAVSRAFLRVKRFEWEQNAQVLTDQFRDKMTEQFGAAPKYPALTVEQMYEGGLIHSKLREFLKDRRVQFFPFSSETPLRTAILQVELTPKSSLIVFKRDILPKDN